MLVRLRGRGASRLARRRIRADFRVEGLEARRLLSGLSSISEFPTPAAIAGPIAAGPDGNLWFGMANNELGEINPTTHAIAEYSLSSGRGLSIGGITAGPDGNLWIADHNGTLGTEQIGMFNPTTHTITEFVYHSSTNAGPTFGITAGPDGNIWFTDASANAIGMISPTTHAITEFALPVADSEPWGIAAGPDGNLWFAATGWARGGVPSAIGEINPTTHAITEFPTPTPNSAPYFITSGPDGNLWFTESSVGQIGEINPTTHAITEFPTPTSGTAPYGIAAGPDGNLWFTEELASGLVGQIGEINPATDAITEFAPPASNSGPSMITAGPDGNLWFTDTGNSRIGVAALSGVQLAVTQPVPTAVTAGVPFGLTVDVENNSGALDSSYAGTLTVSLDLDPGGAPLGGTLSEPVVNGVAVFSGLTLDAAGSGYGLAVSGNGLYGTAAGDLTVNAAPASQLVITQQPPTSVTAGGGFGLSVEIEDPYGNVVTSATNTVTVAMANDPGGTTLGGTTSATATQGVAALGPLTLTAAASGYTLQVSSAGLAGATTGAITVVPAAASQLVITQQPPASLTVNAGFGLAVAIEDAYGNVVTGSTSKVKVALANNPGGAKLGGTLTEAASQGLAAFSGLTLNKVGSGYTLQLSSSGLTGAITNPITVANASASSRLPEVAGAGAPDGLLAPLVLDNPDLWDGVAVKKRPRSA